MEYQHFFNGAVTEDPMLIRMGIPDEPDRTWEESMADTLIYHGFFTVQQREAVENALRDAPRAGTVDVLGKSIFIGG